jgi:ADP-ribose pyrophosphatase YjhB (NUDIX family)
MSWTPHATVAAIIEQNGRFLMVEEISNGKLVINQPAGHVEEGESFETATLRETLEETGCHVELTALVGLYIAKGEENGITYHRLCYAANLLQQNPNAQLDKEIVRTRWMTREELVAEKSALRSPMVLACIDDYLDNQRIPLSFVRQL